MSSKGQITLPVAIRRTMKIKAGDKLDLTYDAKRQSFELRKPLGLEAMSTKLTSYIKPGIKPLRDVDDYYQKQREPRL